MAHLGGRTQKRGFTETEKKMRILVAIYLAIIVAAMAACCSLGHTEKRGKFRNENPKVQMVHRCFNALKANLFDS